LVVILLWPLSLGLRLSGGAAAVLELWSRSLQERCSRQRVRGMEEGEKKGAEARSKRERQKQL